MQNLYNMSIPATKPIKVSLAEHSSESFRTALGKVKGPGADIKVVEDNASVGTIDLASMVIEDAPEAIKVADVGNELKDVIETIIEQPKAVIVDVEDFLDIDDLKVAELKEILDNRGVDYATTIRRAGLIERVKEV